MMITYGTYDIILMLFFDTALNIKNINVNASQNITTFIIIQVIMEQYRNPSFPPHLLPFVSFRVSFIAPFVYLRIYRPGYSSRCPIKSSQPSPPPHRVITDEYPSNEYSSNDTTEESEMNLRYISRKTFLV